MTVQPDEFKAMLIDLAHLIESELPSGPGRTGKRQFAIVVLEESGQAQYVSNSDWQVMVRALRETADRVEADHSSLVDGTTPAPNATQQRSFMTTASGPIGWPASR
jgi:hypothetical protein